MLIEKEMPPQGDDIYFTGKKYLAKVLDGRDVYANELKDSKFYHIYYITGKRKGDKSMLHADKLRHMKEIKKRRAPETKTALDSE